MSTSGINTSGGLTTSSTLTNSGAGGTLQITGLASGINTNEIIQAELSEQELPITNMESEITGLQTENGQLTSIQGSLELLSTDAQLIGEPSLFFPSQSVSSSNPDNVTATSTGGVGTPIGSTVIGVTGLASAAQRTFNFTSPSTADTITIDNQPITLKANGTTTDLADAINSSNTLDVWASASSSGQIVLSSRTTGEQASNFISVSDTAGTLSEVTGLAQNGLDAQYTINGVSGQSPTDTVTGAIPGVTLSLSGVTGSDPATVTVGAPAPNVASIVQTVQQFVSDYNSSISSLESTVNTAPASEANSSDFNPNSGSLYGDDELESMLSDMRDTMITPGAGLPATMASMSDIGISTGASTGGINQNAVTGQLTVNTSQLEAALQSNPNGVQAVLQSWATQFGNVVNDEGGPGGALQTRMEGNTAEITNLQSQYESMQTLFQQQETDMEAQWAQVEGTLSELKSQSTTLSSLTSASSSSSSSSSS